MAKGPYSPENKCPMCGYDASTTFCTGMDATGSYRCPNDPSGYYEHLDRVCRRCGYGWAEETLKQTEKRLEVVAFAVEEAKDAKV